MAGSWSWLLCDSAGAFLAELVTASGRQISYQRNTYAEAQFTISHEDDAAAAFFTAVSNGGLPTLQCYRDGVLRFNGHFAPCQEELEDTALLTATFRGPFWKLYGDGSGTGRFTSGLVSFTSQDAGAIAKSLIDTANTDAFTGLATTGSIATTVTRTRSYQDANVGAAIVALSNVLNGFDFQERYVSSGTTMALFDVFASQGSDMPTARFEYGQDTLRNVRNVQRTIAPPVNAVKMLGGNGLTSLKTDSASIAQFGKWYQQASASDVTEQATLDDAAQELIRTAPVKTLSFTPDYGLDNCPRAFDDFWLGDTVRFYGRRGAFTESLAVRVNAITLVIDENGNEVAEIPDPLTPDEEAAIRASLKVEALSTSNV